MDFRILGSLEAGADGAVVELGPPKQRALLTILLMHAGEIVPTDRLIDLLWGDGPPRTAAHSVQIYVSELRKAFEPIADGQVIVTRPPGYQLLAEPDAIDAQRFERLVKNGTRALQAGDREAGAATLRSALQLWRGPALSDFFYEEFAQPYIRRLHDVHLDAIEELATAELEVGRANEVLPLLDAAIREDPLRERSRELLMLALYRSGRHAEALRSYQKLRELLVEELGLDPSPPLQRLQERILLHDPALIPVADVASTTVQARNPYKGLRPFAEEDAVDYFGRELLLDRVLASLRDGARIVALVGPSGSGKSSVLAAGLIPRLRAGAIPGSDRWVMAQMTPGARPLEEVEAVVSNAAGLPVGLAQLLDGGEGPRSPGSALRTMPAEGRLVLLIDQFEDLFTVTDDLHRRTFLQALAASVTQPHGQVVVLLALRGDYYDRPFLHPKFAEVFIPAVVNVLPMTAQELEAAVVRPAHQVGMSVEPALLAELVAETADQAGALPLLQYALTEVFEQRHDATLTLTGYRALGGLKGILSRRAESLYEGLSHDEQRAAMQVFLRLVRLGHGTVDSRRRVPLSDLTDLDLDPFVLSEVLRVFGRHRLLSFDRDQVTGAATVDVAHEALLREWERLAGWIERHRAALRRHETFAAAVDEWELAGRDADYLLTGSRLAEFETWSHDGTLRLTGKERDFLEAGLARRRSEQDVETRRTEAQRHLEGRARIRLFGLAIAIAVAAAAIGYGVWAAGSTAVPRVALLHPGIGELAAISEDGFDRAVADFDLAGKERIYDGSEVLGAEDLRSLSAEGTGMIIVPFGLSDDWEPVVRDNPNTRYVFSFPFEAPNVAYMLFADQEGAFLAGAAAAFKSQTGTIGFIGGINDWFIWTFHAGYEAGAKAVDPDVHVLSTYLAEGTDYETAFASPLAARQAARDMYENGADVIFHAAGGSGIGVFEAATEMSDHDRQLWAIGVDTDQFETVALLTGVVDPEPWRAHILTSMLKRQDLAIYTVLEEYARGEFRSGTRTFDLASNGVGLAYSGGFIDDIRPRIEDLKARIIAGQIEVPCIPPDKVDAALERGLTEAACPQEP